MISKYIIYLFIKVTVNYHSIVYDSSYKDKSDLTIFNSIGFKIQLTIYNVIASIL
jgi:hypothetical protein